MLAPAGAVEPRFLRDVIDGLSRPQKTIPSQWFYDAAGSELFDEITGLPEYYLTRTEIGILRAEAGAIADAVGSNATLIEYGAGGSIKTRLLLDAFRELSAYLPIDVSRDYLEAAAAQLRLDYPGLLVRPVVADFLGPINLSGLDRNGTQIGFFPGSTIGNLSDNEIRAFLKRARRDLGEASVFVVGYDLRKDPSILVAAYDDSAGVTAAFNRNLLERVNHELGASFDLGSFAHEARWNSDLSRIEMHLVSTTDQLVLVGERQFSFESGESIHTENSRKFEIAAVEATCAATGWEAVATHTDNDRLFAVTILRAV